MVTSKRPTSTLLNEAVLPDITDCPEIVSAACSFTSCCLGELLCSPYGNEATHTFITKFIFAS